MSEMLEQAIVDADALKEAALKNAESAILEKYSGEIKTALDRLLEQPLVPGTPDEEDPLAAEEDPLDADTEELGDDPLAADMEMEESAEPAEDKFTELTMAHTDNTDVCIDGCPDEEQMVEIDLDKLAEALNLDNGKLEEDEEELEEKLEEEESEELTEEEIELTEEELSSIFEKLKIDAKNVPTGQAGGASNETIDEENEDIALATEDAEELEEDEEKKELEESLKRLVKEKKNLHEKNKEYKNMLMLLKEKLDEVNLSNAKLLYTNRVLGSTSLNERQKNKIVEALSKADSVEGAKVIYDTLQSAVGSERKRAPKSLSEAVKKNSSTILSSRKEGKQYNSVSNRWKALAGIK
jgi:chromosome segregation ATPase